MSFTTTITDVAPDVARMRFLFVNLYMYGTKESWVLIDAALAGSADDISASPRRMRMVTASEATPLKPALARSSVVRSFFAMARTRRMSSSQDIRP